MISVITTVALVLLMVLVIPLRFARAVRRSLRDPEFRSLFVLVIVTLAAGTAFYRWAEGWNLLDAFYFSVVTLTTVGYGDLAPETDAGKLFTVFYIFAGIGIIVGFVNAVAMASVEQRGERAALFRRRRRITEREE